jgi:uncharacterized protein YbjT (DUF2867 family)
MMILVTGATGTNGREVVNRLIAAGQAVRALVRDPPKARELADAGAELVRGDLGDAASLKAAFSGADAAFFVAAVDARFVGWFRNFLDGALATGKQLRIVKFSGMGSSVDSPAEIMRQHGQTDEVLAASGLPYTILRPNAFYQNMLWSAQSIKEQGAFYLPMGNARQSLVDVRDIANVASRVLTTGGYEGKAYDITGPESLSYHDVAKTLSAVLGKPVKYVEVPAAAAVDAMLKTGMPEWNARAVGELYTAFVERGYAEITSAIEEITGRAPTSFEQFARDHASVFQ